MSRIIQEAHLVDLTDDQLVDLVGGLWESCKRLDEAMKDDGDIEALRLQMNELKATRYTDDIKRYKARLKAARTLAKARNLVITVPDDL